MRLLHTAQLEAEAQRNSVSRRHFLYIHWLCVGQTCEPPIGPEELVPATQMPEKCDSPMLHQPQPAAWLQLSQLVCALQAVAFCLVVMVSHSGYSAFCVATPLSGRRSMEMFSSPVLNCTLSDTGTLTDSASDERPRESPVRPMKVST